MIIPKGLYQGVGVGVYAVNRVFLVHAVPLGILFLLWYHHHLLLYLHLTTLRYPMDARYLRRPALSIEIA